ncbi:MAG: hypothetical protein IPK19_34830 [Chloroflexi bacterium]|nr:hypothetical protein [Chloroflexota bacterium]
MQVSRTRTPASRLRLLALAVLKVMVILFITLIAVEAFFRSPCSACRRR